ncbi:MAG: hypothetical protein RLZ55_1117 [Actinomycetota bacterium]
MSELEGARTALDGVRVLDLTRLLPGNYASLLLVGLGAEVIKVEDLVGDGTRAAPPYAESGESGANIALNRGKASISLDLKQRDAQQLMLALVAVSDVLLDSFRPGVLDRLGLGPAALAAANPRLVHVSLTAFGSGGPYQAVPAHDLNTEALAGIVGMSVDDAGRPALPAVPIADMATGLQAALAVVAGLRAVATDGAGYRAEVAMLDSALSLTALAAGHMAAGLGTVPAPRDMLTGALACYAYYRCADGGWQAVGALEPKFFQRTCELLGAPELAAMQYDLHRQDELRERLAAVFATRTRDEWSEVLLLEDTCVTPVNDLAEAFADANVSAREVVVDAARSDGSPARVVRAVPWLPEAPGQSPAPLGGDAEQVLRELLGSTADELADLRERGCVGGSS